MKNKKMEMTYSSSDIFLIEAIVQKDVKHVAHLLKEGEDPNQSAGEGRDRNTPLHAAISVESLEIVTLLLQYGANPNLKDGIKTAIAAACSKHMWLFLERRENLDKIIKLQIANGGDLNIADRFGNRPFEFFDEYDLTPIREQFIQNEIYFELNSYLNDPKLEQYQKKQKRTYVIGALLFKELNVVSQVLRLYFDPKHRTVLPRELCERILVFYLAYTLQEKPLALLHLLPYKDRNVDVIETALHLFQHFRKTTSLPSKKALTEQAIEKTEAQIAIFRRSFRH
jgi:hypothetical protein